MPTFECFHDGRCAQCGNDAPVLYDGEYTWCIVCLTIAYESLMTFIKGKEVANE